MRRLTVAALVVLAGCGGSGDESAAVRTDSAGVALVMNSGEDRILAWTFEPELTLGGDDFYRVSRFNVGVDEEGRIYVLDRQGKRVLRYTADGTPLGALGRPGKGPGELEWPISLEVLPDGRVRVGDIARHAVVEWGPDGELVGENTDVRPGSGSSRSISSGRVVEQSAYEREGTLKTIRLASAEDTTVLASVSSRTSPIQLESCGMGFSGMPPLFAPDIRWDAAADRIALVDGPRYDIHVYDGRDPTLRIRRPLQPPKATMEAAVAEIGDGMRVMTQGGERVCESREVAEKRGLAELVPMIERLLVEPNGRVWAQRFVPGTDPGAIDIFEADGEYVGTLAAGTPFPVGFTPDGRTMISEKDELDVERLLIGGFRESGRGDG